MSFHVMNYVLQKALSQKFEVVLEIRKTFVAKENVLVNVDLKVT